eukprot:31272-Pelagococcus_subviridis.AAC.7
MQRPHHARVGFQERAEVGQRARDARGVRQAHLHLVLDAEFLPAARDVQHGQRREQRVWDVVHLAV